jgi:CRP-like cAMP-binding protein
MKWIKQVVTSDGATHANYLAAEKHAEERYGNALTKLARQLVRVEKYTEMITFIEQNLPAFVELQALSEDRKLELSEEDRMSTIYIVTSGEYSSYRIDAVFSTKKLAEDFVARNGKFVSSADIEEWKLDDLQDASYVEVWHCVIDHDGDLVSRGSITMFTKPFRGRSREYGQQGFYGESTVSAEHAQKLAAEERQKALRSRII